MTAPRRRIVRPVTNGQASNAIRQRQVQRLRERLERERSALIRWQRRLKLAFNAIQKHQQRISRIERQLAQLEEKP
jgi:CII-binding regulator of phage lambda lysogenization HflD